MHCRSLSSIHILYNHDPVQALYSLPQVTSWAMHAIGKFQLAIGVHVILAGGSNHFVFLFCASTLSAVPREELSNGRCAF